MTRGGSAIALAGAVTAAGLVAAQGWVPVGPPGGRITALAVSPLAPYRVFGGAASGGLYRSLDGGSSWSPTGASQLGTTSVEAVAIDAADASVVYAGTEDKGIFKSTDGGATWGPASTGLANGNGVFPAISALAVDTAGSPAVLAGARFASVAGQPFIYRSSDGAQAWAPVTAPDLANVRILDLEWAADAVFAASDSRGVWASDDGGVSWEHVGDDTIDFISVQAVTVDPTTSPQTLWAATNDGAYRASFPAPPAPGPFAASLNRSWTSAKWNPTAAKNFRYTREIITGHREGGMPEPTPAPGLAPAARLLAADHPILYVGTITDGVQASSDHGATWLPLNNGLDPVEVDRLAAVAGTPGTLYAGTDGAGVWRLSGGSSSWVRSSDGLNAASVAALAVDPLAAATLYAGTEGGGVLKSLDAGAGWSPVGFKAMVVNAFDPWVEGVAVDPNQPGTVYALLNRTLFRSGNGGGSWSAFSLPAGLYAYTLTLSSSGGTTVLWAAGSGGVARSDTRGETWTKPDPTFTQSVASLAVAPSSPQTLYAGTRSSGIYKSTNEGVSWSPVNNDGGSGFLSFGHVAAIAVDPRSADTVFLAVDRHAVWKTTNGGASWDNLRDGLFDPSTLNTASLSSLVINPGNPNVMFAGAVGGAFTASQFLGVYRSNDAGGHWAKFGSGLPAVPIDLVMFDPTNANRLYAAARGHGIYRYGPAPAAPAPRLRERLPRQ
jgi:hypothetical protein